MIKGANLGSYLTPVSFKGKPEEIKTTDISVIKPEMPATKKPDPNLVKVYFTGTVEKQWWETKEGILKKAGRNI